MQCNGVVGEVPVSDRCGPLHLLLTCSAMVSRVKFLPLIVVCQRKITWYAQGLFVGMQCNGVVGEASHAQKDLRKDGRASR